MDIFDRIMAPNDSVTHRGHTFRARSDGNAGPEWVKPLSADYEVLRYHSQYTDGKSTYCREFIYRVFEHKSGKLCDQFMRSLMYFDPSTDDLAKILLASELPQTLQVSRMYRPTTFDINLRTEFAAGPEAEAAEKLWEAGDYGEFQESLAFLLHRRDGSVAVYKFANEANLEQ